jgi:hypothetical protein
MKTLKLSSLFMLLSLLSMGMGFPDIISEKDIVILKKSKKQKETVKTHMMACSREIYVAAQHKHTPKRALEKQTCTPDCWQQDQTIQPAEDTSLFSQAAASLNNIALKVFDIKGNLLLKQQMRMDDFLSSDYAVASLPEGSIFVMFHGNTAYYFLDNKN